MFQVSMALSVPGRDQTLQCSKTCQFLSLAIKVLLLVFLYIFFSMRDTKYQLSCSFPRTLIIWKLLLLLSFSKSLYCSIIFRFKKKNSSMYVYTEECTWTSSYRKAVYKSLKWILSVVSLYVYFISSIKDVKLYC